MPLTFEIDQQPGSGSVSAGPADAAPGATR